MEVLIKSVKKYKYVVFCLLSIIYILFQGKAIRAEAAENWANTVTFATQKGEWLYLKDAGGFLCKVKTDGSKYKKLTEVSLKTSPFILYKDYLYYFYSDETSAYIYRMKTDGSEKKKLTDVYLYGSMYGIIGDYIYYGSIEGDAFGTDGGIPTWKIKLNGTGKKCLNYIIGNEYNTVVDNGYIYDIGFYFYDRKLYARNVKTDKGSLLLDGVVSKFKVSKEKIYYSRDIVSNDGYGEYQSQYSVLGVMGKNGKNNKTLVKSSAQDQIKLIDVQDQWIYYLCGKDDNYQVYRVKTDGSGKKKIINETLAKNTKVTIAPKKIVYTTMNGEELWSGNLDGTKKRKIAGFKENTGSTGKQDNNGFIFFLDDWRYEAVGDWIYFYKNGAIYRASLSKGIRQLVTKNNLTNKEVEPKSVYSKFLNTLDEYEEINFQYVNEYALLDIDEDKADELILYDDRKAKIYIYQYKNKKITYLADASFYRDGGILRYNKKQKCVYIASGGARGSVLGDIYIVKHGKLERHTFSEAFSEYRDLYEFDGNELSMQEYEKTLNPYTENAVAINFKTINK